MSYKSIKVIVVVLLVYLVCRKTPKKYVLIVVTNIYEMSVVSLLRLDADNLTVVTYFYRESSLIYKKVKPYDQEYRAEYIYSGGVCGGVYGGGGGYFFLCCRETF